MTNYDSTKHVRGESKFVDDLHAPEGLLHCSVFYSSVAHGKILNIDYADALRLDGVVDIITYKDIPGENQIGGIIQDEPLFAVEEVHFVGQPIALIVAQNKLIARKATRLIKIKYKELPAIFDARKAYQENSLIIPPRIFSSGNVEDAFKRCKYVIEGLAETGAQEHLYFETQSAVAFPTEGGVKIISSTQSPTQVQRITSKVLKLPMNKIEVDVPRLGGGFGGKEDQATPWAVMTALAATKLNCPAKLILPRQEDMRITGKRHPYSSDYKIGFDLHGKILAYEVTFYQNAGAAADLSPAVLDRTLFHCTNSYYIPNVKASGISCKTNLPPNTAFRGFGGPQGMFVIEAALNKAAEEIGIEITELQRINLLKENDLFHFGQKAERCTATKCFSQCEEIFSLQENINAIKKFNQNNYAVKKGIYIMPVCFGISFTTTFLNQASALVHIYADGSIGVSTAAVEMGQGVNEKIRTIVSNIFSVEKSRIKIESTNTSRNANTSATAASKGADLNGFATKSACETILSRLKEFLSNELNVSLNQIEIKNEMVYCENKKSSVTWNELIQKAYFARVNLSAHAHHATKDIFFDKENAKGKPFAYHVYGSAITEVTLDCLRGTYQIDSVKVVHDFGKSLHPLVDKGQTEGAIVQGIGWMTLEEILYDDKGRLTTDALSTYKIPDIHFAPNEMKIIFLEDEPNPFGPFQSKAIGEPPLMYGIGAFFAIRNAMKEFEPEKRFDMIAPLTNERVLMSLHSEPKNNS